MKCTPDEMRVRIQEIIDLIAAAGGEVSALELVPHTNLSREGVDYRCNRAKAQGLLVRGSKRGRWALPTWAPEAVEVKEPDAAPLAGLSVLERYVARGPRTDLDLAARFNLRDTALVPKIIGPYLSRGVIVRRPSGEYVLGSAA